MTDKDHLTPTEAVRAALEQLLPGEAVGELDDDLKRSPRRGPHYVRTDGAWRPANTQVTRAVCDVDHCSNEIEHGHSFFFDSGRWRKELTGPTFRDDDKTRATIEKVLEVARSRKSWPLKGMDVEDLRKQIEAEVARRERERKQGPGLVADRSVGRSR